MLREEGGILGAVQSSSSTGRSACRVHRTNIDHPCSLAETAGWPSRKQRCSPGLRRIYSSPPDQLPGKLALRLNFPAAGAGEDALPAPRHIRGFLFRGGDSNPPWLLTASTSNGIRGSAQGNDFEAFRRQQTPELHEKTTHSGAAAPESRLTACGYAKGRLDVN